MRSRHHFLVGSLYSSVLSLMLACSGTDSQEPGGSTPQGGTPAAAGGSGPGSATERGGQSARGGSSSGGQVASGGTRGGVDGQGPTAGTGSSGLVQGGTPTETGGGGSGNGSVGTALPKHWHQSKGFGTSTQGGLAGQICKVTTLNASGSGSLKDCMSGSNKLVVFEVGGVIDLNGSGISVGGSNVTIAGQTAPSPGITLIRGNFSVSGDDIVVSHIAVQLGDGPKTTDASNISGSNVVYDHVSVWWGTDETLSLHGVNNVTLFKSIVAEALQFSGHRDGEHSKGSLINNSPKKLSLIGSFYANNAARNPRVDGGEVFFGNHVVHNWGPAWDEPAGSAAKVYNEAELANCTECFNKAIKIRGGCNASLVNSVAFRGPDTKDGQFFISGHVGNGHVFEMGSIIIDQVGNPLTVINPAELTTLSSPAIFPEGFEPLPAEEGFYEALRTVGPRPGDRDANHARLIRQVAEADTSRSEIIDSQDEVGGYPQYPATTRAISEIPEGAAARQAWLDQLEDELAVDRGIDLSRLYGLLGSAASDRLR